MFLDSMPDPPQIETPREIGQNYQLFIPIMFRHQTMYVPDVLGYYVVHKDSHSHTRKTFEQKLHILDIAKATLWSISDRIDVDESERAWFKDKIAEYDCKNRLDTMQHYMRKDGLAEVVKGLKTLEAYDSSARRMVLKIKYPWIKKISDLVWKVRN